MLRCLLTPLHQGVVDRGLAAAAGQLHGAKLREKALLNPPLVAE
jgi:hypothetical protein